ncbi:2-C-methyl-D-erythritol 4-phosphate cytidylyltransferase [Evansella clarkii]|uniref:2-C-methyl-D-erythritol 4-phosphate cytidylyltransferase n=1 Tax=Evansella clarkii TaxID=79879 RepID=UPI000B4438B4|nr:2-C-methyl-D-erythritol 4-phosphate cytidylyltransferase [Evansella clarkii]
MEKYNVVIPAAGQGKRMRAGKNKQFINIGGIPLLIHTLHVFEEDSLCEGIILAVNKNETEEIKNLLDSYNIKKVIKVVEGGKERQQSVFQGLKAIEGNPVVLIHDGARPFVQKHVVHKLVNTVTGKGACVTAVPVKDTIKQAAEGKIHKTIDRSSLWAVQTPQAFRHEEILKAHKQAAEDGFEGTDDASLIEYTGGNVYIIEGDYENIKITTPEDIMFGEAIISKRKGWDE